MCPDAPCETRWRMNHRDMVRETQRKFREAHPNNLAMRIRLYRLRHPERKATRQQRLAWKFLQDNYRLLGSECEFCGGTEYLRAHHPDYGCPEIFLTCCSRCHSFMHKGTKQP